MIKNKFLQYTDIINLVSWIPADIGPQALYYSVYRDAGLTQLISTVYAQGPLEVLDRNRQPNTTYTYYIVAVDVDGNISSSINKSITT